MKRIVIVLIMVVSLTDVFGQQDPQYSLYMFNPLGVNPAYAGSREVLSGVLVHRTQWVGLDGAPETQTLALNTPLKNKNMGVGLEFINDKIGPRNTQHVSGSYAYRLKLGQGRLAFGLRAGLVRYQFDWAKIDYQEQEDAIPTNAPQNFMRPNFDFGIYYNTKTFYAGIAIEHLNKAEFRLLEGYNNDTINSSARQYANANLTIGKAFVLNDNLVLKSSLLLRAANKSGNLDLNASLLIKNKVQFGLGLRSTNALIFIAEINMTKNLRLGLAYDIDGSEIAKTASGSSFEVFLGYDIGLFKSKVVSPRYF